MQDEPAARPPAPAADIARLRARAGALLGTLRMADALVTGGRDIDLTGLDEQVGRLCAASLDLPPEGGHAMRADLIALRDEMDVLSRAMRERARGP